MYRDAKFPGVVRTRTSDVDLYVTFRSWRVSRFCTCAQLVPAALETCYGA